MRQCSVEVTATSPVRTSRLKSGCQQINLHRPRVSLRTVFARYGEAPKSSFKASLRSWDRNARVRVAVVTISRT